MSRQLAYLVLSNFSILFVGMGVFPLLPLYAGEFGASRTAIGLYLALTYVSITAGTLLAGWLAGKASRKTMMALAGGLGALALFLLGRASALWQVAALTGVVWFTGGVGTALISVFAGLHAGEGSRGKWFGLISLTTPLGAIAGGLLTGRLAQSLGYPAMFAVTAVVYTLWPLVGWFLIEEVPLGKPSHGLRGGTERTGPAWTFPLLLLAALFSAVTISVNRLGMSLSMNASGFSLSAITGANVAGGLAAIPVVLWLSPLSDRLGRKFFLALGYLLAAAGGITLILAGQLWHFWLVAASTLIARSISVSLASALATDILAPEDLGRGLPWLNTMTWVAGVLGYAGSGFMMDAFGPASLYMSVALLSLAAAGLAGTLSVCQRGFRARPAQAAAQVIAVHGQGFTECPAP